MLIGLHGKKQAGKDTVYERLVARLGPGSETGASLARVSFADLLYESAAASLGVTVAQLQEWKAGPAYRVQVAFDDGARRWSYSNQSVRGYLQNYGTEAHRDIFGPNFWVDNVNLRDHDRQIVVVTDVRFRNEAQAVSDAGGAVVHVIGPDEVEHADHSSEETLPAGLIDYELANTVRDDGFITLDADVLGLVLRLGRDGYA